MRMHSDIFLSLQKLVSISSLYPSEGAIGEYIFQLLKNQGYTVEKQHIDADRFNVVAEKGAGTKSIMLYAHLDTVGVAQGWNTNPLTLTVVGNKAYGLGAWDMKAGLLANIIAFQKSNPKNKKLKIVFCVDEEYISRGGHTLIKSPFMRDVSCVLSTEPAFKYGVQGIITGRIGRAVYDVVIKGQSQHFALYQPERDMNNVLADFIQASQKLYKEHGEKKQFVFARSIESQTLGMSLPEKITLQLDSSILPPHTHESVLSFLTKAAAQIEKKYNMFFSISIEKHKRITPFLEPYTINRNNSYLTLLRKSVFEVTKKLAVPYFRSSVADENIFGASGVTTLGIGPVGGNAHSANEWVDMKSLQELIAIVTSFISAADEL